jgi:NADH:ubiquinone reductase (H+-translocating)
MTQRRNRKRVVILGAGAAGVSAALEFKKGPADACELEVMVVDQRDYHHPLPFMWQVVSGSVGPGHVIFPLNALLRKGDSEASVEFRQCRVQSVDLQTRVVRTDDGELEWDYLVVALGSTTSYFGMRDAEEHSLRLKSLTDAVRIHNHILDSHEAAEKEENDEIKRELLTFAVIGGGPTGIELAAAIQDFVRKVLPKRYPSLTRHARVLLVEAQNALLSGFPARMSELAVKVLRARGVHVLLGARIVKVWSAGIETADGQTIPTRSVIWVAGVKPVPVVESLLFGKARDGRVLVDGYLGVPGTPGVYVIGDCAYLLQQGGSRPYPPTQQVAERQGPACARNIMRTALGKGQLPFRYRFKGQVIYMGRNSVVVQVGSRVFNGIGGAFVRWGFYTWQFLSYLGLRTEFRRKAGAVREWIAAYFYRRSTSRLDERW